MGNNENVAYEALAAFGYDDIDDNLVAQFLVLMEALELFRVRDPHHKSLWKEYGASDTAFHCKSKALRLNVAPPEHLDDALDLINYAAFTIRNVREGRL